jgi:hypothetical protein
MTDPSREIADGPPRPALMFSVGVIAQHCALPDETAIHRAIELLATIRAGIHAIDPEPWFKPGTPDLRILSAVSNETERQLADGARTAGYTLDLVLPAGAGQPDHEAGRCLQLACTRLENAPPETLPNKAIVAHGSLILAIWDGRADSSTAKAVGAALDAGTSVIHVPFDADQPIRLLARESAALPSVLGAPEALTAIPCTKATLEALLAALLLPPDDPAERARLRQFFGEPLYPRNLRLGYPLLLAVTGTQKLRRKAWDKQLYLPEVKAEWARFKAQGGDHAQANAAMLATLEASFRWANHLGSHFAQTMRSALVINFSFSALAVVAALAGLATTAFKLPLALAEILIIIIILINIRRGGRSGWQRRWLDYRCIAERLRLFRSLKLLGIASEPRRVQRKGNGPRRWIDWYVAAIWREMGAPHGVVDPPQLDRLRHLVSEAELSGEIAYHRTNARRMRHLEERLHLIGDASFVATLLVCTLFPILYFASYDLAMAWSTGFVMLSAGLPAIGGAIYALRVHGDYAGAAARSLETAAALDGLRTAMLDPDGSLARVAALATAAARVMLVDLDEWQMTYAQRSLAIPA